MNVAFHELAALAITSETAAWIGAPGAAAGPKRVWRGWVWTVAFVLAVGSHGILDALPHYYPLGSWVDAVVSFLLVGGVFAVAPRWLKLPLLAVCAGAILPDAVDHVARNLNRHFHLGLPDHAPIFPWHWRSGSGSYPGRTGPLWLESWVNHAIVLTFCGAALWRTRGALWGAGRVRTPASRH